MTTIKKADLVKQVADHTGLTIKDTETTINSFLSSIANNLKSNNKVQFTGFGSFNAKNIPARRGRNPSNGKEITISARRQVSFSVGKEFKGIING